MLSRLTGNQQTKEVLHRMLTHKRVPGAMIFAGEEGIGKKLFALEVAKALNCRTPVGVEACDKCSACVRAGTFTLPAPDDAEANKQILWSGHRDVGLVRAAGRFITVPQIREIERETNYRPFEGTARFFLIEDADRLNEASSNALLKTLEEVPPTSHLILITARPSSLLPTIRSRCQTIRFAPLAADEIESFLIARGKRSGEEARLAAQFAGGRLGAALEISVDDYRAGRELMMGVIEALTVNADRVRLLRAAEELSDAKNKEHYEPRLDVLQTLVHDLWLLTLNFPEAKIINEDLRERLARLSDRVESNRVAAWLSRIEELRGQLAVNINRRVATDALLLSMAAEDIRR